MNLQIYWHKQNIFPIRGIIKLLLFLFITEFDL